MHRTNKPRISRKVMVDEVAMGASNPIVVQAMTDTDTVDDLATAIQCRQLSEAGADLVRITVNVPEAAKAVPLIRSRLDDMGCRVPLIGDFHYNGHKLLSGNSDCAKALAKYRINPGNVGRGTRREDQFSTMIKIAIDNDKVIRIGANWGSLDQEVLARKLDENAKLESPLSAEQIAIEALVASCLESATQAENLGLATDKIVLSAKVSRVPLVVDTYRALAKNTDYPLHIGLTEAGMSRQGIVASSVALAILLEEDIGDTIRVSLTPMPGADRCEEVRVAWSVLQSLELRYRNPSVTACPGCGRTTSDLFRRLAAKVQNRLDESMQQWRNVYPKVEMMRVAVMGCVVNGPGESKHADIGISLPGTGENPVAIVYADGKKMTALKGNDIAEQFIDLVEQYVKKNYTNQ